MHFKYTIFTDWWNIDAHWCWKLNVLDHFNAILLCMAESDKQTDRDEGHPTAKRLMRTVTPRRASPPLNWPAANRVTSNNFSQRTSSLTAASHWPTLPFLNARSVAVCLLLLTDWLTDWLSPDGLYHLSALKWGDWYGEKVEWINRGVDVAPKGWKIKWRIFLSLSVLTVTFWWAGRSPVLRAVKKTLLTQPRELPIIMNSHL